MKHTFYRYISPDVKNVKCLESIQRELLMYKWISDFRYMPLSIRKKDRERRGVSRGGGCTKVGTFQKEGGGLQIINNTGVNAE